MQSEWVIVVLIAPHVASAPGVATGNKACQTDEQAQCYQCGLRGGLHAAARTRRASTRHRMTGSETATSEAAARTLRIEGARLIDAIATRTTHPSGSRPTQYLDSPEYQNNSGVN